MASNGQSVLARLPAIRAAAADLRELLLADIVMIGEIPSPTFSEADRVSFILERFADCGLQNPSSDEVGNGFGLIPGSVGDHTIVVAANADTIVEDPEDQTVEIEADRIEGPFVGDNSVGLAALTVLPTLLERLGITLRANLLLMTAARMLNRGNLEGLKFYLGNASAPPVAGLYVEGVQLGRLNHACLGTLRGEIICRLPDDFEWAQHGKSGTILPMSDIVLMLSQIPLPQRPRTHLVTGMIRGGISCQNIARETRLGFEVRSESSQILDDVGARLREITGLVASRSGVSVRLDLFTRREPGGIEDTHPLVRGTRSVLEALDLKPMMYLTTSPMSAFFERGIPALTLGITRGSRSPEIDEIREYVDTAPMATGLAQLAGTLMIMDEARNHENS
ncbi:MAG TPA: peptidase [Verrucomicrobiae bacterium]|nr:peptidase [Verrucomicrobiae bacterium]